jgi:aminoglycoside phosphotransferase (APT) family kinase protein
MTYLKAAVIQRYLSSTTNRALMTAISTMHNSTSDSVFTTAPSRTTSESDREFLNPPSKANGIDPSSPPPATDSISRKENLDLAPGHKAQLSEFPCPQVGESEKTARLFNAYRRTVSVASFLQIACDARGGSHTCEFGERRMGGFNVAIILRFSDGEEWIVKTPKFFSESSRDRLESEVATLVFLRKVKKTWAPKLYAYSLDALNASGTPYILMQKMPGVTLEEALSGGMKRECVHRVLEDLAEYQKALRQHQFVEIGSLMMYKTWYHVSDLMNIWSSDMAKNQYQSNSWDNSHQYYFQQHSLSLAASFLGGDVANMSKMWLLHAYMAAILPAYAQPAHKFYLAHTDLSISNIMVDPDTGALTGIIDWEFANTLPLQAVEHYPGFLAEKDAFVESYEDEFDDAGAELEEWRAYYAKQFQDDPEISAFHDHIDAIIAFEYLLRNIDERTVENVAAAVKALKSANALVGPLPRFPWNDDNSSPVSMSGIQSAANSNVIANGKFKHHDIKEVRHKRPFASLG